jgi:large subunit ribosomal protein L6
MSRIGNNPISIPQGVEISIDKSNKVTVKGPNGELMMNIHPEISVEVEDGTINVTRPTEQKRHKSLHGLSRSLINNMVEGVEKGFKVELELHGIGYRASNKGQLLNLALGYSHPVVFYVPDEIKIETETPKGQPPVIRMESANKELLGQIASKIKAFRKTEPYKGKGVRTKGEYVRRKEGKTAG